MAQGSLKATRLCLVRVLQLAACRPYNAIGELQLEEPPTHIRWKAFPLYNLAAFRDPLLVSLEDTMRVAQDMAAQRQLVVPGAIRNDRDGKRHAPF
jgi:hypothetical protein